MEYIPLLGKVQLAISAAAVEYASHSFVPSGLFIFSSGQIVPDALLMRTSTLSPAFALNEYVPVSAATAIVQSIVSPNTIEAGQCEVVVAALFMISTGAA
jgi:hypothetical protein